MTSHYKIFFGIFRAIIFSILTLFITLSACGTATKSEIIINHDPGQSIVHDPLKTIQVCVDSEFKQSEKIEIAKAISEWESALSGVVAFAIVDIDEISMVSKYDSCRIMLLRAPNTFSWVILEKSTTLAATDGICGKTIWLLIDRIDDDQLRSVIVHEIGHSFCLMHTPKGIMRTPLNKNAHVGVDDAVWAAYFLGIGM